MTEIQLPPLSPTAPEYPCRAIPETGPEARKLGIYGQRQEGLFMQRTKILGGRLTLDQWQAYAQLAQRLTPNDPLHLTTRQDIEFHSLTPEAVIALHEGLAAIGINTLGACGDTTRNVTLCPDCGLLPGTYDLEPLARLIHAYAQSRPDSFALPRKFKISLSGTHHNCAKPYINDISLVANEDGSLRAIMAGGLGAKPNLGILCYERLERHEVMPLIAGAIDLFSTEGDRKNRARARLRHVRERLGDEPFRQRLDELMNAHRNDAFPVAPAPVHCEGPAPAMTRLSAPRGDVAPEIVYELVDLLRQSGGQMRIGIDHKLHLYGVTAEQLPASVRDWVNAPTVIACPGAHLCTKGLSPTWDAADEIRARLPVRFNLDVSISGCPNNCPQSAIADIGFIGRLKSRNGQPHPHYRLLAGGGHGRTPVLATELHPAIPVEQAPDVVDWLVGQWQAGPDETAFGDFIAAHRERLAGALTEFLGAVPGES
jgi:sulfite reductase beta subunit-like hemoprotein